MSVWWRVQEFNFHLRCNKSIKMAYTDLVTISALIKREVWHIDEEELGEPGSPLVILSPKGGGCERICVTPESSWRGGGVIRGIPLHQNPTNIFFVWFPARRYMVTPPPSPSLSFRADSFCTWWCTLLDSRRPVARHISCWQEWEWRKGMGVGWKQSSLDG